MSMTNWPHLRRPTTKRKSPFWSPQISRSPIRFFFLALTDFKTFFLGQNNLKNLDFLFLKPPLLHLRTGGGNLNERVPLPAVHFPLDSFYISNICTLSQTTLPSQKKKLVHVQYHTCIISNPKVPLRTKCEKKQRKRKK